MEVYTHLLLSLIEHEERMCFVVSRQSGRFEYANAAFKTFFKNEIFESTQDLFDRVHPDDKNHLKEHFNSIRHEEFKNNIRFRILFPEPNESFLQLNLFCMSEGHNQLLTGYIEDLTAVKSHDDKLNELSNRKNAVLNVLSHDLAGPLGSIQNIAGILARETKSMQNAQVVKWIDLITQISKKSIHLIQEFVKQEFIESEDAALVKLRINLAEKLPDVFREYEATQADMAKSFKFHTNSAHIYADVDETKFFQVISNLISNAMKFTPDGGTISLNLEEKDKTVVITVADTGIGIPAKFHAGLFNKFNDARRTGLRGEPSVGLGMSIIKTIVGWHDGRIWFESEVDKGTTFFIEIPKNC